MVGWAMEVGSEEPVERRMRADRESRGSNEERQQRYDGCRLVEGTVGALNPFKYNQYQDAFYPRLWMIFTVHLNNP